MTETRTLFLTVLEELNAAFVSDTRNDGTVFYKLVDNAPEWLQGSDVSLACHKALDDRLPDDWVYEQMTAIASDLWDRDLDNADDAREAMGEIADSLVDVYNADRARWLASHLNNAFLVDDAVEELGGGEEDTYQRIGLGQYVAIERIGYALIQCIEEEAETREAEAEEDDN